MVVLAGHVPLPAVAEPGLATIADTAHGAGSDGGSFFVITEINGKATEKTALTESMALSYGRGSDLRVRPYERNIPAGRASLRLSGRYQFAAPIQNMFKTRASWLVEGLADVDLLPDHRYKVNGVLDAYRREVWLEDEATGEIPGTRIVAPADASADSKSNDNAYFTCCNLHYEDDWISDGNWTTLPFIPAGARIAVKEYGRHRASVFIDGRPMRIGHDYGRDQESKEQFVAKLMVKEDPKARISGFDKETQAAIRAGKVMLGMTKEQVIMSLGYPRTDLTRSLGLDEWTYSTYENDTYVVIWDSDERVKEVDTASRAVRRAVVYSLK
jgi:hypothetical protein